MLKFKNEKINDLLKRSIISIVMLLIVFPILFATYYGHQIGRAIGFALFALVLVYSVYEIFQHFKLNKFSRIILSLVPLYIYFLPVNVIEILLNNQNLETTSNNSDITKLLVQFTIEQFRDYNILIGLVVVVVAFLLEIKNKNKKDILLNIVVVFFVIYLATLFFKLLWLINVFNVYLVLFLGFIAVISDVFGYLVGNVLGHKIFSFSLKVSPKKSLEGFLSSFIFSALFVFLVTFFGHSIMPMVSKNTIFQILLILILPIAAIIGDLFFSFIKRFLNIKDFSKIIKNHGGFFDRFDSTSFVFFFFAVILIISF